MRKILFKAKRVDNGEWVEGFYEQTYTYDTNKQLHRILWNDEQTKTAFCADIIPETLCEFTGLCDKNGKRIWENDIVLTQPFYDRPYSDKRKSKQFLGIVEYQTSTFNGNKFYPKQVYQGKWGLKYNEEHGKFVHFSWGDLWGCEVVGNRFDNPVLLAAERSADNEN